jgi:4-hydroxybenzoyl-CoA thioesterase
VSGTTGPHHVMPVEVTFGDCDPARLVFYPRFFEWFDKAAWALFSAAGFSPRKIGLILFPLVDVKAKFSAPVRWGERLEIATTVLGWRRSSFRLLHEARVGGAVRLSSDETRVWARPTEQGIEALAVPEEVKAALPARAAGAPAG